ncbi:helix-turn-helix domain-containing protein [Microbacterium paludicola]|uniref:helix-turn-helix domain-containing protein n=1 Tax=Microbacterium paludicola TaxID=300019 RepID=UPI0011A31207|nr:helix-turn-helix domain-containing protein [Microbacterium paludicola]
MRAIPVEPRDSASAIGARLRAARTAQQMTIDQLAHASGLTKGFLSRVERDQTSPSVSNLVSLCDVLNIAVGTLFTEPDLVFVAADEAPEIDLGGTDVDERLLSPRRESRIQVIRSRVRAGEIGGGGNELYSLNAEIDFLHVVAGTVRVLFANNALTMTAGDSLTLDGREPHSWEVVGDDGCDLIWVLAPATWAGQALSPP